MAFIVDLSAPPAICCQWGRAPGRGPLGERGRRGSASRGPARGGRESAPGRCRGAQSTDAHSVGSFRVIVYRDANRRCGLLHIRLYCRARHGSCGVRSNKVHALIHCRPATPRPDSATQHSVGDNRIARVENTRRVPACAGPTTPVERDSSCVSFGVLRARALQVTGSNLRSCSQTRLLCVAPQVSRAVSCR